MVQKKGKKGGKKVAAAPLAVKKIVAAKVVNPLFEKRPKNFSIYMEHSKEPLKNV